MSIERVQQPVFTHSSNKDDHHAANKSALHNTKSLDSISSALDLDPFDLDLHMVLKPSIPSKELTSNDTCAGCYQTQNGCYQTQNGCYQTQDCR